MPNGLCSSITESKHIKAVKEPWRRSSRFEALGQMLVINECLDKLAATHVDFRIRGMLYSSLFGDMAMGVPSSDLNDNEDNDADAIESAEVLAEVKLARTPGTFSLQL